MGKRLVCAQSLKVLLKVPFLYFHSYFTSKLYIKIQGKQIKTAEEWSGTCICVSSFKHIDPHVSLLQLLLSPRAGEVYVATVWLNIQLSALVCSVVAVSYSARQNPENEWISGEKNNTLRMMTERFLVKKKRKLSAGFDIHSYTALQLW